MKRFLVRVLAAAGLVPARRHARLRQHAEALGHELRACKKRAARAATRAARLEKRLDQRSQLLKKSRAAAERDDGARATLQADVGEFERALASARAHMMAIEVKLDILEGAANVLDARTRVAAQRQPDASGAPV